MKENYAVGIEFPEEQSNWENIQFTISYGVGIDHLNVPFSYNQYRCYEKRSVMDISLDELFKLFPDMKRFKKALINAGFTNTRQKVSPSIDSTEKPDP